MDPGIIAREIAVGLVVGVLVGLTGLGGGMVLLPLLISVLGIPPILAVGSDAVINCITKIGAGGLHWRQGNVNWRLVLSLAYGSIPGAILGVMVLARVRASYGAGVNDFLKVAIGLLLILIPVAYLLKFPLTITQSPILAVQKSENSFGVTLIGFIAGLLVGITSIGSGSVILMLLMVFYGLPPALMVGTDIVHAILLAGLTGLLQFRLGNVNLQLVVCVLIGSFPGGLLGAYLTNHVPSTRLKQILCTLLVAVGARMLWGSLLDAN
ncbi:MAG TPA: sulfite exporter TauE/SafE family protein [Terriglobales bacterium]